VPDALDEDGWSRYDDLAAVFSGQTLLREGLLAADHTSYHLGQLILVRRALGAWKG
jgi:hypothetical protein